MEKKLEKQMEEKLNKKLEANNIIQKTRIKNNCEWKNTCLNRKMTKY